MKPLNDHPAIARALRTGYPAPEGKPPLMCDDTNGCDTRIYPGDTYYDVDGLILCEECGREYLDALYRKRAG